MNFLLRFSAPWRVKGLLGREDAQNLKSTEEPTVLPTPGENHKPCTNTGVSWEASNLQKWRKLCPGLRISEKERWGKFSLHNSSGPLVLWSSSKASYSSHLYPRLNFVLWLLARPAWDEPTMFVCHNSEPRACSVNFSCHYLCLCSRNQSMSMVQRDAHR